MHNPAITVAVLLSILATGCSSSDSNVSAAGKPKAEGLRKPAPNFTLKDSDGKTVNLSDYKGKVVLLNFWATWCGPCKIEIPWFVEFEQKYKDRGFAVLGVSMDEDGWEIVKPYLQRNKINYRILLGDDKVATAWGGVESLPTTFALDREGRIVHQHIGLVSKGDYENEIRALLEDKRTRAGAAVYASAPGTNKP